MNEKSGMASAPMPTGPPMDPGMAMASHQQGPPPPYSPYSGPTELDASKPYPPMPQETKDGPPIGFTPGVGQPPQQIPQQQPPMVQQVIVPQQIITTIIPLGPTSVRMTCPFCQADMNTSTTKEPSIIAWISAGVCCLVGCVWGCCLIPLCMDSCKKIDHHCANCKKFLGKYVPIQS